jgi:hypothetical protein
VSEIGQDPNSPTTPLYPGGKAGTRADVFVVTVSRPAGDGSALPPAGQEVAVIVPLPRTVSPS